MSLLQADGYQPPQKLEERGIIRKRKTQVKGARLFGEMNTYTFIHGVGLLHKCVNSQNWTQSFQTKGEKKNGSVREEIAQLTKGLRYSDMTPGSLVLTPPRWKGYYLEGLLQTPGRDEPRPPGPASGTEDDHAPSAARVG